MNFVYSVLVSYTQAMIHLRGHYLDQLSHSMNIEGVFEVENDFSKLKPKCLEIVVKSRSFQCL